MNGNFNINFNSHNKTFEQNIKYYKLNTGIMLSITEMIENQ